MLERNLEDGFQFGDLVFFHDPCHGQNFDRDGRHIGGPGLRGMYQYDVSIEAGRIMVDTSLARPGPYNDGIDGGDVSLDRLGVTNDVATRWRDAVEAAGAAVRGSDPHPFVWALGAWQEPTTDVITVDFTIDGVFGELQIGPDDALPEPALPDADRVEVGAGTLRIADPSVNSTVIAVMRLPDGEILRFGVLLPSCRECGSPDVFAPSREDLIALIDRTVTAALE